MQFAPELEALQAFNPSQLWIRMQFAPELEALQAFNPSQLWIRMQFAPELEEPQAFNWSLSAMDKNAIRSRAGGITGI